MKKIHYSLLFILGLAGNVKGQNVTSPYSILGIGDIETKDYGRYFGMGGNSFALSNANYYNPDNPASVTSLDYKLVALDFNTRGRSSRYQLPRVDSLLSTLPAQDFSVRRISLTFKTGKKWGFSFGLKPFSSVNYLFSEDYRFLSGTDQYTKTVSGSGGLNQVYLSGGYQLTSHFSAGVSLSYLFGSLSRETLYQSQELALNIKRSESEVLRSALLNGGLLYRGKLSGNITHSFGLTITAPAQLSSQLIKEDFELDTVLIQKEISTGTNWKLPFQWGAGYALTVENALTATINYSYHSWEKQPLPLANSFTAPASRLSAGLEYRKLQRPANGKQREAFFVQAGWGLENTYMNLQSQALRSSSVTLGAGTQLTPKLNVYAGLEWGVKGNRDIGQIKETFTQFSIGLTLKDIWFASKRFGQFD